MIRHWFIMCVALCIGVASGAAEDEPVVFHVDAVNPSLPPSMEPPNLETPQAAVEHFMLACRDDDFASAARSLDFRLRGDVSSHEASEAARKLFFVLNQRLWIDWDSLPDRPDGMLEGNGFGSNTDPMIGSHRRSIRIGDVELDGRDIPICVHRVKATGNEPVWLFSAQTVDNIEALYSEYGPGWLDRNMPDWARARGWGRVAIWKWIVLAGTMVIAPLVGCGVTFFAKRRLDRFATESSTLGNMLAWPIAQFVAAILVWIVLEWGLSLPHSIAAVADPLAIIAVVASAAWIAARLLSYAVEHIAKDVVRSHHEEDAANRQRMLTQLTVARHALMLLVAVVAVGVIMLQLDMMRAFGVTLLTSAGAAAVILGIAGHTVLGNLIAGIQIALTQPFTLGDTVYIEDNWGVIEDITYTYVIVKTWDDRRLVLPIKYFVNNWIENWSLRDPFITKPVYLEVDYRADVDRIRETFLDMIRDDEAWASERDHPEALVTDIKDDTMIVRLTCAGEDSSAAWSLSCRVRENMLAWLREEANGAFLPRRRIELHQEEHSSDIDNSEDSPARQS